MISKLFHVSPLVIVQKIDQRVHWGTVDKQILLCVHLNLTFVRKNSAIVEK